MENNVPKGQAPNIGFVIATKRITQDEQKVGFLYREEPMDAKDSGWRIFAGDETQDYVDDPANSSIHTPAEILMIDDSILPLLESPVGAAFEREGPDSPWEEVPVDEEETLRATHLGGDWWMELSEELERVPDADLDEEEEGDLVYVAEGRTLRITLWEFEDKSFDEIMELHRSYITGQIETGGDVLESFDLSEPHLGRLGMLVQEDDEDRDYHVLYSFTVVGKEVVQSTFYFDDAEDVEWALTSWRTVRALRN